MLAHGKVKEVERLLAEGKFSQRKISKLVGVSRGTISAIANGQRPDYEALARERGDDIEPQGPIERCQTCGGRVYMPCRLCRVRALQQQNPARLRQLQRKARQMASRRILAAVLRYRDTTQRDAQPTKRIDTL